MSSITTLGHKLSSNALIELVDYFMCTLTDKELKDCYIDAYTAHKALITEAAIKAADPDATIWGLVDIYSNRMKVMQTCFNRRGINYISLVED